jgi:hypothetical protein
VVGEDFATVVATGLVLEVGLATECLRVVVVFDGRVVVVVAAVVDGAADVVVAWSGSVVRVGPVTRGPASPERRMAGSWLRWGTPATPTPTAAHRTSMAAVIERCPGLTAGPSRASS